jgi:hypothetical protein
MYAPCHKKCPIFLLIQRQTSDSFCGREHTDCICIDFQCQMGREKAIKLIVYLADKTHKIGCTFCCDHLYQGCTTFFLPRAALAFQILQRAAVVDEGGG